MKTPDGDGNLPSGDSAFVESLKVCQSIDELTAQIGPPEFVIAIEEGRGRQYAFSRVMKTAILVVVERPCLPLEFMEYIKAGDDLEAS